jgi:hypothetical protein
VFLLEIQKGLTKIWKFHQFLETTQNWKLLENVGAWLLFWVESFHLATKKWKFQSFKGYFWKKSYKVAKVLEEKT